MTRGPEDAGTAAAMTPAMPAAMPAAMIDGQVRRVLWIVLGLNLAVAAAKLIYGVISDSVAIHADGIHSLFDGGSNIVGLVALRLASSPADASHPYGHRKFESMAALLIGVSVTAGLIEIVRNMVQAARGLSEPRIDELGFVVAGMTLLVNVGVTAYESRAARRLGSEILSADARHTLGDAFATFGVMAGFAGVMLGYPRADLLAACLVCVLIAHTAWQVFARAFASLLDAAELNPADVIEVALALPGIEDCHAVRSRSAGGHVLVDLHIQVDPDMTVAAAHELTHAVEAAIRAHFPTVRDVVIHTEPVGAGEP